MVNMGPGELAPEDPARTPGPTQQYRGFKTCKLCFLEELKKTATLFLIQTIIYYKKLDTMYCKTLTTSDL